MGKDKKDKKEKKSKKEKKDRKNDADDEGDTTMVSVADISMATEQNVSPAKPGENVETVEVSKELEKQIYNERLAAALPISKPMASKKLSKKAFKVVKKASSKKHIFRGVKEVVKYLRKAGPNPGQSICLIAADISPMDVISHIPVLCEDSSVPYVWVVSKEELGIASGTKRGTSCVLVVPGGKKKDLKEAEEYISLFKEVKGEVESGENMIV